MQMTFDELSALGTRIKISRKVAGFERAIDFRNQALPDITESLYYQFELGRRKPKEIILKKIANTCRVNFCWLKTGEGDPLKGIKIKNEREKAEKESILSFYSIEQKYAVKKDKRAIPKQLSDKMKQYSAISIPSQNIVFVINVDVMKAIFNELIEEYHLSSKPVDTDQLSEFAAQIYADIVSNASDPETQLHAVKIASAHYKRIIQKESIGKS